MTLVVGTDEAGYGPNLGPLVIAATLWDVAGPAAEAEAILAAASAALDDPGRDSKQVYRGGSGWAALEHGALAHIMSYSNLRTRSGKHDLLRHGNKGHPGFREQQRLHHVLVKVGVSERFRQRQNFFQRHDACGGSIQQQVEVTQLNLRMSARFVTILHLFNCLP
jgi:hypothetical protein